jgi:hypothetical protein
MESARAAPAAAPAAMPEAVAIQWPPKPKAQPGAAAAAASTEAHALRAAMLAGCEPGPDAVLRAAAKTARADPRAMVSHLLALRAATDVVNFFGRAPHTRSAHEAAAAVYALQMLGAYTAAPGAKKPGVAVHVYAAAVDELVAAACNVAQEPWATPLAAVCGALADEALYATAGAIDASRFAADAEYQREVLDALAGRGDAAGLDTGVSLARRHGVDPWPVYMAHLRHALVSGDTDTDTGGLGLGLDAAVRRTQAGVMQRPGDAARAVGEVLAQTAGTDLARRAACHAILAEALAGQGDSSGAQRNGMAWRGVAPSPERQRIAGIAGIVGSIAGWRVSCVCAESLAGALRQLRDARVVVDVGEMGADADGNDAGETAARAVGPGTSTEATHALGKVVRLLHGADAEQAFYGTVAMRRVQDAQDGGDAAWEAAYVRVKGECMPHMAPEDTALLVTTLVGVYGMAWHGMACGTS